MKRVLNIKAYLRGKIQIFLALCLVFLLSACGDEVTDCGTIQSNMGGCMLCPLFEILRESATEMANKSWNDFAEALSTVILIASAIYIALSTLKMVGAFGKQNVADFLTSDKNGLFILLFKTAIIYYILAYGFDTILEYLIQPLFASIVDIAKKISPSIELSSGMVPQAHASNKSWKPIFDMLYNLSENFNNEVSYIIAIGQTMACVSTIGFILKWKFLMLIYGSLIFIFGWMLLTGISFYLIDIMVRALFAAVLLPLGIACAISKLTVTYTKNIWNLFLNVVFNIVILGIILDISLKIILLCLGRSFAGTSGFAGGHQQDMLAAINANQIEAIGSMMQGFGYLLLTVVSFSVIFNLIRQMGPLAENISDTAGFSPASEAMAPFVQSAAKEAKKVGSWGRGIAGSAASQIGHDVSRGFRLDKMYKWSGNKATGFRGYMTGSGSQGYKAFWRPGNLSRNWFVRGGRKIGSWISGRRSGQP